MTTSPDVERLANLRAAKDLVDRSYAEALDLDAIAREAGYSRFLFIRSFRDTFGRTPREYLSFRRVERARELLRSANLTVTEVCYLVGFASLGSLSARFKAEVGLSPSAYRDREVRGAGAPPIPRVLRPHVERGAFRLKSAIGKKRRDGVVRRVGRRAIRQSASRHAERKEAPEYRGPLVVRSREGSSGSQRERARAWSRLQASGRRRAAA